MAKDIFDHVMAMSPGELKKTQGQFSKALHSEKNPEMENFLEGLGMEVFGRSRELARALDQCIACGKPATEFRDQLSHREYLISHLCQSCQDKVFEEPEE